jgi:hypothetical protein
MPIDPSNDPNEAYEVAPMKVEPHGPPGTWWSATCNGIPVYHFAPGRRDAAERYCTDPAYRLSRERQYAHDRAPTR